MSSNTHLFVLCFAACVNWVSLLFCSVILLEFLQSSWSNLCSYSVVSFSICRTLDRDCCQYEVTFPTGDCPDTVLERFHTDITSVSNTLNIHPSDSKADSYTISSIDFLFLSKRVGSILAGGREIRTILSAWLYLCKIKETVPFLSFTVVEQ